MNQFSVIKKYQFLVCVLFFAMGAPVSLLADNTVEITNYVGSASNTGGGSLSGQSGSDGKDGQSGHDGKSGKNGKDGQSGANSTVSNGTSTSHVSITSVLNGEILEDFSFTNAGDSTIAASSTIVVTNDSKTIKDAEVVTGAKATSSNSNLLSVINTLREKLLSYVSLLF